MAEFKMYNPEYKVIDVFKSLKTLKKDELLPEGGALDFFYQNLQYPGISLFLRYKNKTKFFYIDHDEFIVTIKDQTPEWGISIDKNLLRLILHYKVNNYEVPLNFVFDLSNETYIDLLNVVRKNKEIKLYYLTMIHGGIAFDSYVKLKVPSRIINALKQVK